MHDVYYICYHDVLRTKINFNINFQSIQLEGWNLECIIFCCTIFIIPIFNYYYLPTYWFCVKVPFYFILIIHSYIHYIFIESINRYYTERDNYFFVYEIIIIDHKQYIIVKYMGRGWVGYKKKLMGTSGSW